MLLPLQDPTRQIILVRYTSIYFEYNTLKLKIGISILDDIKLLRILINSREAFMRSISTKKYNCQS